MDKKTYSFNNSRKAYLTFYFIAFFLILIVFSIKFLGLFLNKPAFVGATTLIITGIFYPEIIRLRSSYKITPDSLVRVDGFVKQKVKRIFFGSITEVCLKQNYLQRFFGYGDVEIFSMSGSNLIEVKNINKPNKFINILEKRIEEHVKNGKIYRRPS